MGYCLYGNDIDDTTSPIEAGLGWITKFTKSFTNHEALLKQKEHGVERKLVGFELNERGVPRKYYPIVDAKGNTIGARLVTYNSVVFTRICKSISNRWCFSQIACIYIKNMLS